MDELTKVIVDALRTSRALNAAMAFGVPEEAHLTCLEAIADDIAPLIEARVREQGPCICNRGPDSAGPDEDCPQHGRPYGGDDE